MNDDDNEKEQFLVAWKKSPAAQLLIPNPKKITLHLGKKTGDRASIAFLAFKRGQLDRLDHLIVKWIIKPARITKGFKEKLNEEKWLKNDERREARNNPLSALSELMVADYLDENGFNISDLSAWNDECEADIKCKYNKKDLSFEVKFIPDSPEFEKLRIDAVKNNNSPCNSMPSPQETCNFYFYRLAEAVLQLESKKIAPESGNVFFVFSESASNRSGRDLFEECIERNYDEWYRDDDGNYPGTFDENRETILSKKKSDWLKETEKLYLATMKDYALQNVKKYN